MKTILFEYRGWEMPPEEFMLFIDEELIDASINMNLIDEWGYLPLDLESGQLLFSVISNAYERLSLIITTNLPFNEWGPLFTDEQLVAAMIDRIVHYEHLIKTGNKDWSLEHALMND